MIYSVAIARKGRWDEERIFQGNSPCRHFTIMNNLPLITLGKSLAKNQCKLYCYGLTIAIYSQQIFVLFYSRYDRHFGSISLSMLPQLM